jgi:SAM-dependent methyltransferase
MIEVKRMAEGVAVELAGRLLAATNGDAALALEAPAEVAQCLKAASPVIAEVGKIVHAGGVKTEYFDTSVERYRHYLAAAMTLPTSSQVLEVGAAPGHISIALHLVGYRGVGLNLNELWRATYPSPEWLGRLDVREHDVEKEPLPFSNDHFDAVMFTETLEHVAITDPATILREIRRVLRPGGPLIFSTPNVCNISNVFALLTGVNVFWPPELFYGGLDRHNREYTPGEVRELLVKVGFEAPYLFGINDHNNWRFGANHYAYAIVGALGDKHPLLRNTTMAMVRK